VTEKNIVNTVVLGFRGTKSIGIYSAFCSESLKEMSSGNNNNNKNKNKNKVQTTRYKQQGTNNKVQTTRYKQTLGPRCCYLPPRQQQQQSYIPFVSLLLGPLFGTSRPLTGQKGVQQQENETSDHGNPKQRLPDPVLKAAGRPKKGSSN